jgi:hypothetical protein
MINAKGEKVTVRCGGNVISLVLYIFQCHQENNVYVIEHMTYSGNDITVFSMKIMCMSLNI